MDQFIQEIAREAGGIVRPYFLHAGVKYTKNNDEHDVVTEADLRSNDLLVSRIRAAYPAHGIISEEVPKEQWETDREYTWILDPLDGTKMFTIGWPLFGVMIALAHKGEIEMAAIYFPMTGEQLFAKRGGGAWLNGAQIKTSSRTAIEKSCGSYSDWFGGWRGKEEAVARSLRFTKEMYVHEFVGMHIWSIAPAIKSVAEGRQDWMFSVGSWWDFAPAKVILEEAGCIVTNGDGEPLVPGEAKGIIAANPVLHPQILDILSL
ncbi:inositol monophosphatase [Candidatus Uhrbacteria bacterium]|nr:inositol monophosphatase [Candidatus Uhrbacteria bacterium]